MSEEASRWQPNWTVSPREVILEALTERHMTQRDLARVLGIGQSYVHARLHSRITVRWALQLEAALGPPAELWLTLQRNHDLYEARRKLRVMLADIRLRAGARVG